MVLSLLELLSAAPNCWRMESFIATISALFVGFVAGLITGLLHTKGKINALLSGILMMIALYSINFRIMGKSNVPLFKKKHYYKNYWVLAELKIDEGIKSGLLHIGLGDFSKNLGNFYHYVILSFLLLKKAIDFFFKTDIGLGIRATGDNETMIRSFSADTDFLKIFGLGLSNAFVAFSGALLLSIMDLVMLVWGLG